MDSDLSALRQIQAGDENGLRALMAQHKEAVFRFAVRYTGNETDAAELTEDVFLRVYNNARRFEPRGKVSSWIFSIAANLCRDHLRRRKRFSLLRSLQGRGPGEHSQTEEEQIPSPERNPADNVEGQEVLRQVESAIRELPPKLSFPFIFCVLEGHSYDECAEVLEGTRKVVENRIYRARQQLRVRLQGFEKF